jgi:hypothetical protein
MSLKHTLIGAGSGMLMFAAAAMPALAASTIVVTPTNTQGWSTADTRPGGAVNFVADSTAPSGVGALQLTTDATTAAKAQYMHAANTSLASVTDLSYYTKQNSASFVGGDPSYQLAVYLDGTPATFTTLVYEPYENGVVTPGVWQQWDVAAGQFWSSRTVTSGTCATVAGAGGAPFYTLAQLKTLCPNAVVVAFGVNVGTFNPSYDVETDLINFNGTAYDFEPFQTATAAEQCKNGGWQNVKDSSGASFKNQGDCVSFVASKGKNKAAGQ